MTKEQKAAYQREWVKKNPNYQKEWNKQNYHKKTNKRLKWMYGITLEQYNQLFAAQNGCCKICSTHQGQLRRTLCVDHDHKTGKIRGLLCDLCNRGLGYLKDNTVILLEAIKYLNENKDGAQ